MIRTFRSAETKALFDTGKSQRFQSIERVALRKLMMVHAAKMLTDLSAVPGNRLETLKGDRDGQHSIINDQWRVCFVWRAGDAEDVEIVDYH
jgi:proteic killer suppression protein